MISMSSKTVIKSTVATKTKQLSFEFSDNFSIDITQEYQILIPWDTVIDNQLYDKVTTMPSTEEYRLIDEPLYVDTTQPLKDGSSVDLHVNNKVVKMFVSILRVGKLGELKNKMMLLPA